MTFTVRPMKNSEYSRHMWAQMIKSGHGCLYAVVNQHDLAISIHMSRDIAHDVAQDLNEESEFHDYCLDVEMRS